MQPKIAIFVSFSGTGGVERMILNLADGFAGHGVQVDLLLIKSQGISLPEMASSVRIIHLNAQHTFSSLPALMRYLLREKPLALLSAKDRANQVAIAAKKLSGQPARLVVRMGTTVSAALAGKGILKKWIWYLPMRLFYRGADKIVAVSRGVHRDMLNITGLNPNDIEVIANPVISTRIHELAQMPVTHPWLSEDKLPIIVGAGRLTRQKDFPTLIKAFAKASASRPLRLVILGEGNDRDQLTALTRHLGIEAHVNLPGFEANPYMFIKRASLFVLSSIWEGSPNVLTEALALGTPVVATDCQSGPREILENGRYGPLVPIGDPDALAAAMLQVLDEPPNAEFLKMAVREYTVEFSSRRYLDVLLGSQATDGKTAA